MFKSLVDELGIKGHLTIHKVVNGEEELLFDNHNIIVSGFGWTLANLYGKEGSDIITDYQIDRFKLGLSGHAGAEAFSATDLSGPLSAAYQYVGTGDSNLDTLTAKRWSNNVATASEEVFARIPFSKVTRVDDRTVRYTILVDENSCNGLTLNEIGLFIKNPKGSSDETSVLAAYRYFTEISKSIDFAIVFRWTISFG